MACRRSGSTRWCSMCPSRPRTSIPRTSAPNSPRKPQNCGPSAVRGSRASSWGRGPPIARPIRCSRSARATISASPGRRSTMSFRASRGGSSAGNSPGLLSSGAGDSLRDQVSADVGLIGKTVRADLLLSANADLYLKGDGTPIETRAGPGVATPSGTTGTITILASANDFAPDLHAPSKRWQSVSAALRAEADALDRRDGAAQAERIKDMRAEAAAMQARVDQSRGRGAAGRQDAEPAGRHQRWAGQGRHTFRQQDLRSGASAARSTADAQPGSWQVVTYLAPRAIAAPSDAEVAFLERLKSRGPHSAQLQLDDSSPRATAASRNLPASAALSPARR